MQPINVGTKVWKKAVDPAYIEYSWTTRSNKGAIVEMEVVEEGFIADNEYFVGGPFGSNHQMKGRVRAARVLSITSHDGKPLERALSAHVLEKDDFFDYKVGDLVQPREPFEEGHWACGSGIHCFTSREQAVRYEF